VNKFAIAAEPEYMKSLNEILSKINDNDINSISKFGGFMDSYLPKEFKREEITYICGDENIYILRIDYFTNFLKFSENIQFDKHNKSFYNNVFEEQKLKIIDESQNKITNENELVIDCVSRKNDREFFQKILPHLKDNKKIIIQNSYKVENVKSTLARYVVVNGKYKYNYLIIK
jgi:hypothetical protein